MPKSRIKDSKTDTLPSFHCNGYQERDYLLYTRGSVAYYETYTGKNIPRPIEVRLFSYDEAPNLICDEVLALTKMNWNNT